MYECWYDFVKSNYKQKAKICYTHTDSFLIYIYTKVIYADIAKNVEVALDTSNDELDRKLSKEKNNNTAI